MRISSSLGQSRLVSAGGLTTNNSGFQGIGSWPVSQSSSLPIIQLAIQSLSHSVSRSPTCSESSSQPTTKSVSHSRNGQIWDATVWESVPVLEAAELDVSGMEPRSHANFFIFSRARGGQRPPSPSPKKSRGTLVAAGLDVSM